MSSPSYFSGSFSLLSNKFKELIPYLLTIAILGFLNEFLRQKFLTTPLSLIISLLFTFIILIVTVALIKTILHLLRNEETSPSANIEFFKKHSKEFLYTLGKYIWKLLKITGIPLVILVIVGVVFATCSSGINGFPYPPQLIESLFAENKLALSGSCTIGFYLSVLLAPISIMLLVLLAVIANIRLFFTFYSFVDHKTKITEDHTKISNELTKGKKGEFIVFLIVAGFGFAIIAFISIRILQPVLPSKILDIAANSLLMAVFTVLYTSFFAQYYLTLKENHTK